MGLSRALVHNAPHYACRSRQDFESAKKAVDDLTMHDQWLQAVLSEPKDVKDHKQDLFVQFENALSQLESILVGAYKIQASIAGAGLAT